MSSDNGAVVPPMESPTAIREKSSMTSGSTAANRSAQPPAAAVAPTPTASKQQQARMEECDYDKSPTLLYKMIEKKAWDQVVDLFEKAEEEDSDDDDDDDDTAKGDEMETGGGTSVATSNSAAQQKPRKKPRSVIQEASVWVVRKEHDGRLRWRLLPLHAALIFDAPLKVIDALIRVFPLGATLKDDQGMLPLHLACRNAPPNFEVLEELLTAHPAAVYVKDRKGRTPILGGLAATGRDQNPGLSVMELYTQIAAAGEKQRWRTEQEQQTLQKLRLLTEEHQVQLASLRNEYDQKFALQDDRHAVEMGSLTTQLKATRIQLEQSKQEYETLHLKHVMMQQHLLQVQQQHKSASSPGKTSTFAADSDTKDEGNGTASNMSTTGNKNGNVSSNNSTSSAENTVSQKEHQATAAMNKRLQTNNKQLLSLVHVLLDQQSSLRESLRSLLTTQDKFHGQRNAIMRQYCHVNDQAASAAQAHATVWQEELVKTEQHIMEALRNMTSASSPKTPTTTNATTTRKTSTSSSKFFPADSDSPTDNNVEKKGPETAIAAVVEPSMVIPRKNETEKDIAEPEQTVASATMTPVSPSVPAEETKETKTFIEDGKEKSSSNKNRNKGDVENEDENTNNIKTKGTDADHEGPDSNNSADNNDNEDNNNSASETAAVAAAATATPSWIWENQKLHVQEVRSDEFELSVDIHALHNSILQENGDHNSSKPSPTTVHGDTLDEKKQDDHEYSSPH